MVVGTMVLSFGMLVHCAEVVDSEDMWNSLMAGEEVVVVEVREVLRIRMELADL